MEGNGLTKHSAKLLHTLKPLKTNKQNQTQANKQKQRKKMKGKKPKQTTPPKLTEKENREAGLSLVNFILSFDWFLFLKLLKALFY